MIKKILLILLALLIILSIIGAVAWTRRASIAAEFIHRSTGVPASIGTLDLSSSGAQIENFKLGNPPGFRSSNSFKAETISIATTWKELTADPLTINQINMDNLTITVESKKDGTTNWDQITAPKHKTTEKSRHYLIKVLVMNNLTVQAVKPDGTKKVYPPIPQLVFYNISDETGFPVEEIEKAIFNLMMQNLFQQLDLKNQLLPLIPGGKNILPFLP